MTDDDQFTERLISKAPVTVRRRVLWGECDPAQVVYTPRFSDYLVSAAMWFTRTVVETVPPGLHDAGLGTPAKAMSLEFHHVLRPNEFFDMTVSVTEIRERTFGLRVEARGIDDVLRFTGSITLIVIDRATFRSTPLPDHIREALSAHIRAGA